MLNKDHISYIVMMNKGTYTCVTKFMIESALWKWKNVLQDSQLFI